MRIYGPVLAAALCFVSNNASAHEMRPAYLELREVEPGICEVIWKVPARGTSERLSLQVSFSDEVKSTVEPVSAFLGNAHVQRWRIHREGGFTGARITIDGLASTFTDALLRFNRMDGTSLTHRFTADEPEYEIEASPSTMQVVWTYLVLGVEHILLGLDHLLFVLALLLIVEGNRKLILTITSFTLAHSITLALASLGLVNMPGAPVEAVIALSIVFVASEIIHGYNGRAGMTARSPWIVAFTFGLLHGFGFAGALSEIGLPQNAIPLALLFFNVGVEVGQLAFVFVVLVLFAGFNKFSRWEMPDWASRIPPYAIGSIAAFWLIERTVGFWGV